MAKKTNLQIKMNLKQLMDERGLSVDELAYQCRAAGTPITRTTIYHLRNEPKGIHMTSLVAICSVMNISPADLFIVEK